MRAALARIERLDPLIGAFQLVRAERARAEQDGHTTAFQAGEVGRQAGVKRLLLCHLTAPLHDRLEAVRREAEQSFGGSVEIAEEFREYRL